MTFKPKLGGKETLKRGRESKSAKLLRLMGVKRLGNAQSPSKVLMIEKCDDEARALSGSVENFAFKYDPEAFDPRDKTKCLIYPSGTDCLPTNREVIPSKLGIISGQAV